MARKIIITESQLRFIIESVEGHTLLNKFRSFNELSDKDLEEIAIWGLEGYYSSSGCWDDACGDLSIAVKCALDDFKLFLSKPYPIELGDVPAFPIIYRLVRLKDKSELNIDSLGSSWFSNPDQPQNNEFFDMLEYLKPKRNVDGTVFILKARTPQTNINIPATLWERSTQWWENEIVVLEQSKIELLEIKEF